MLYRKDLTDKIYYLKLQIQTVQSEICDFLQMQIWSTLFGSQWDWENGWESLASIGKNTARLITTRKPKWAKPLPLIIVKDHLLSTSTNRDICRNRLTMCLKILRQILLPYGVLLSSSCGELQPLATVEGTLGPKRKFWRTDRQADGQTVALREVN